MWISSSTAAGGGVHGRGDGIARGTIDQVGTITRKFPLFIGRCHRAGGIHIGKAVGERIDGSSKGYHTRRFNKTGTPGKRTDIGRNIITGV